MWWLCLFLLQDVQEQAQRVRAAMQPSIDKQRASIQRQVQALASTGSVAMPKTEAHAAFPCEPLPKLEADKMIEETAAAEQIEPAVLRQVVQQESSFYPCAVSPKGAVGLMQLMPETQAQFHVNDPTDPKENLAAGAKVLKELIDRYGGDLKLALGAYNAGWALAEPIQDIPPIPETKHDEEEVLGGLHP